MTNQNRKISSLKIILGFLILAVVLLFGVYFLLFQNIKYQNTTASELQNEIDLGTKQNQYATSLKQSLQDSDSDISKVNNSILPIDGDVGFIEQLENLATNEGLSVSIDSLSAEDIPNVDSDDLTSLLIKVNAQGSWTKMMDFLSKLETLPNVSRMEEFDLANSSDNPQGFPVAGNTQSWQVTFQIRVLQYK
jgi:Tfp pilus assembly protein PilO